MLVRYAITFLSFLVHQPLFVTGSNDLFFSSLSPFSLLSFSPSLIPLQVCISPDYVLCSKSMRDKLLPLFKQKILEFYGLSLSLPLFLSHKHTLSLTLCLRISTYSLSDFHSHSHSPRARSLSLSRYLPILILILL